MKIEPATDRFNHALVNDVPASQHLNIVKAINGLNEYLNLAEIKVYKIIEIGTLNGGFTTLLANHEISNNAIVHTFDIKNTLDSKYVKKNNTIHYYKDVFAYPQILKELMQGDGNVLLFCDGGNKIKEFNQFAEYLKKGDIIFCHDYARDRETFETHINGKIWNWHEISYKDIAETVRKYGLEVLLPELFELVVWGSFIKK